MKFIRGFFRTLRWLVFIAFLLLGLYAWRSGLAEQFYRENESTLGEIELRLEKLLQSGAKKLNDAIPVRADGRKIDISQITGLNGSGISGDGYTFPEEYYPYYAMLSDSEKSLYRDAYANAKAYAKTFVPSAGVTCSGMKNAIEALFYDHPELFWLDTGYSFLYGAGDICIQVTLQYLMDPSEIPAAQEKFDEAVLRIAEAAAGKNDDYGREKAVHDTLARSIIYEKDAPMGQSAYSALVLGQSVCAGYSRAFQHVLMCMGIPAYYCTGRAEGDHSWNIVKLGDGYYNVDLTWDDSIAVLYTYFNRTDTEFSATHAREGLSLRLPSCTAEENSGQRGLMGTIAGWLAPRVQDTQSMPEEKSMLNVPGLPEQNSVKPAMPQSMPELHNSPPENDADGFLIPGGVTPGQGTIIIG